MIQLPPEFSDSANDLGLGHIQVTQLQSSSVQVQHIENEQISQKLQLNFDGDSWSGIVSLFYFDETRLQHKLLPSKNH